MKEPSAPTFRFRSELAPRYSSILTVVVAYLLGASILFGMTQFLFSFYQFHEALGEADLLERRSTAAVILGHELAAANRQTDVNEIIARFASKVGDATGGHEDASTPGSGQRIDSVTPADIVALHEQGASRATLEDNAGVLARTEETRAGEARVRADRLMDRTAFRAALLGFVIILNVFGGGLLFLKRWRHVERLLQERTKELEEVDASRRLFFATASHELRTPVTVLLGEAEVALAGDDDLDGARAALRHIAAHARFLGHRIEEMIAIARTSDGKLHLDAQQLDYRDVVSSAVHEARWFAASVESELDWTAPDRPVVVVGDALWLKRALLAVIENALKFSPMEGRVTVRLERREEYAAVTVTDKGPGVMPEELPLIFKAYYQTEMGKMRGGTGLGLSMTRWIAEQHGGRAYARNLGMGRYPDGCAVTVLIRQELAA
jgi:signal transduction histidine kinase